MKLYNKPEIIIAEIMNADIITASGTLATNMSDENTPETPINTKGMLGFKN